MLVALYGWLHRCVGSGQRLACLRQRLRMHLRLVVPSHCRGREGSEDESTPEVAGRQQALRACHRTHHLHQLESRLDPVRSRDAHRRSRQGIRGD